jgi:hypothetical protein
MQIHLSEQFSQIQVINADSDLVTIQCALWPSWSELLEACQDSLNAVQIRELEDLFRAETASREFVIEDQVLKIRAKQSVSI